MDGGVLEDRRSWRLQAGSLTHGNALFKLTFITRIGINPNATCHQYQYSPAPFLDGPSIDDQEARMALTVPHFAGI
jgi:hypothetical protein